MSLNELASEIHAISKSKGFWPHNNEEFCCKEERNPAEVLMLIVTEVAEAMEAIRDGDPLNEPRYQNKTGPDLTVYRKPVGVPSEMADILIRVLDACAAWGVDIDAAVREKIGYNATREILHGRAS